MQLQKIASSRTGGSKTDEALGKTNSGPEGLPHSIIVTDEGVEGEVTAASQVDAAGSEEASAQQSSISRRHLVGATRLGHIARAIRWPCLTRPPTPNPSRRAWAAQNRRRPIARNSHDGD
jgi:hypothetical protein